MHKKDTLILAIESSCDDTSAAVLKNETILSNLIAGQKVHEQYGGVVPELASRAHMQHILPVVDQALKNAGVNLSAIDGIAFTRGPGLPGSLMVGVSFAKALALSLAIPLVEVNHMEAHVLAHFIDDESKSKPEFPFLCLTVSGGHTQLVLVRDYLKMEVIGSTLDDAAGEAFDKAAKMLGFPYPGGPYIDRHAKGGFPLRFDFARPKVDGLNYSFSGLKTSILYFLQKQSKLNPNFIQENLADLCASIQHTIIEILFEKVCLAMKDHGLTGLALAGGVSANSSLRLRLHELGKEHNWHTFVPRFEYCTDNAAMIAIAGRYRLLAGLVSNQSVSADPRLPFGAFK